MKRTIENLKNEVAGKLYVSLKNESVARQFLDDAENEGYAFGEIKPTKNHTSDFIAVLSEKQLAYVGTCGRIAAGCNSVTTVDYEKYKSGDDDYLI